LEQTVRQVSGHPEQDRCDTEGKVVDVETFSKGGDASKGNRRENRFLEGIHPQ